MARLQARRAAGGVLPRQRDRPAERPEDRPRGPRPFGVVEVLLGLALLAVLALAPLAELAVASAPLTQSRPGPALDPSGAGGVVRALPAGLPASTIVRTTADVAPLATTALGPTGARLLLRLLPQAAPSVAETALGGRLGYAPYPYRYPALTRLLDDYGAGASGTDLTALGASLMVLSARLTPDGGPVSTNAAPAAYAVLDRARSSSAPCAAQLDLLALVAADRQPQDAPVLTEEARSDAVCRDDPTAGWLVGQYESQRATPDPEPDLSPGLAPQLEQARATRTFARLTERFPGSAEVLTGSADVALRQGLRLRDVQPFTARYQLRAAAAGYRAAQDHGVDAAASGLGRALTGLGETGEAGTVLAAATRDDPTPGPDLEVLLEAKETAHDFSGAETVGRRLARMRSAAYPRGVRLFPVPGDYPSVASADSDVLGPMSVGATSAAPFTIDLQPSPGGADTTVEDLSFIPVYRDDPGYTGSDPGCPAWAWRRDAVLAGHPTSVLATLSAGTGVLGAFPEFRPHTWNSSCGPGVDTFRAMVQAEAGRPFHLKWGSPETLADSRQNMWRWAGDLARAQAVVDTWPAPARTRSALPLLRTGEIAFLRGRYDDAATAFGEAARRERAKQWDDDLMVDQLTLDRGASLLKAGRRAEGMALLRSVAGDALKGSAYQEQKQHNSDSARRFGVVSYYASAQLAGAELAHDDLHAAADDYGAASDLVPVLTRLGATGLHPDAVYADLATAQVGLGRPDAATASIDRALARDPRSPAYLMTAGFAALRAGDRAQAVRRDEAALTSDPGAFPAANDLGVLQARLGDESRAVTSFRQAVGVRPDYALGWFNLGVLYSRMGLPHLLQSQGALARAFRLDPQLEKRSRELTIDAATYRTRLDLSRPLPPRWSFAGLERRAPTASVGLLAMLLAAVALARTARRGAGADLVERLIEPLTARLERLPGLARVRSPLWGIAAVVVLLALPLARFGDPGAATAVVYVLGVVLVLLAALRGRVVLARRAGSPLRQVTWGPGLLFGLLATAFGAVWAPVPVVDSTKATPAVHAAAPLVTAAAAAALFVEVAWSDVPLARSLALAALVMSASTLLPVRPLDGARLEGPGLLAGVGVVGLALLATLGLR